MAVVQNNQPLVQNILERDGLMRALNALPTAAHGKSPLMLAVEGQNEMLVSLLLRQPSIDVNVQTRTSGGIKDRTALMLACNVGHQQIVQVYWRSSVRLYIFSSKYTPVLSDLTPNFLKYTLDKKNTSCFAIKGCRPP